MAYGKKYYMSFERTFENPKGESVTKKYLFNIYFQGYTGTAIELPCMGDSPVVLRYDGDKDNIFEPILGGSMEFELVNQTGFVFDDMIEAGDADCWCELLETGVTAPTITGYLYSDSFLRIEQNPSGLEGSPARLQGYGFQLTGETINLADNPSNELQIPYTDSASFPIQAQEAFTFMLNHLNALLTGKGVSFVDAGNNVMQVKSVNKLDLLSYGSYRVGDSKVQVNPDFITQEPTPIIENVGSSQIVFSGFLSPAGIVRSYTNSTHIMRFVATDGLNLLNGQSYGVTQADLSNVKIIDVIKNALNFRNAITTTAIKDDLFIEWDFTAASQGQQGGSQCSWVMVETGGTGEYIRVAYEFIVRVYRLDGIAYDTYTFKNKGDNDKLYLSIGEYEYAQDGGANWIYYDSDRMIEEASRLFSSKLQEELRALNVNSDYLYDVNNKTIGIKSSVKVYLERVVFDGVALTLSNSYTSPVTSPIDLHTLGNEGCLFAGKSLYDNMSGILKSFGWRMYHYKGWRIERVLNIGKGTRTFKKYANVTGDVVEVNLVSIKDEASGFNIESGATETRISSWKDAIFKQPYGKKDSLIYNSFDVKDFAYTKEFNSYAYKWATGTAYCLKGKSGKNLLVGTRNNTVDYAIFKGYGEPNKLTVKYIAVSATESVNIKLKVGDQWLGNDGILHSTMQTITRQPDPSGDVTVEIDFITNTPTTLVLFLSNQTFESGGRDALVSEFSVGGYRLKESSIGYELQLNINQLNRNKTKEVEFLLGTTLDAPQYPSYYAGLINSNGTPVYAVSDGINTGRLADIIANEYAYVYARNRMCISGTLLQNVEPNDSFKFANGKMLAFASIGSFDIKRNRLDGEFVEIVTNPYILYTADLPVINIAPLDTPTLATSVLCTYSDGTAANANITWKPFNYTFPGTYYAEGSIGVNILTIKQQVIIGNIISYTPLADVTVSEGMTPTLPTTAHCTTDNGFTRDYSIEWGEYSTATQGTFVVKGHLFNGFEVSVNMVVTAALSDLDILRQIRDANPTSQLPTLWLDSEDPYTQWEGVTWNAEKTRVSKLYIGSKNISTLQNVNKLTALTYLNCNRNQLTTLDVTGLSALTYLNCNRNQLTTLDVTGLSALQELYCYSNQLTSISSLTSKGSITYYDFRYNNFPTAELDRFRAMGFTDESKLLPQNP